MSTDCPELLVAVAMRDAARNMRALASRADMARLALVEEEKFIKRIAAIERRLEAKAVKPAPVETEGRERE